MIDGSKPVRRNEHDRQLKITHQVNQKCMRAQRDQKPSRSLYYDEIKILREALQAALYPARIDSSMIETRGKVRRSREFEEIGHHARKIFAEVLPCPPHQLQMHIDIIQSGRRPCPGPFLGHDAIAFVQQKTRYQTGDQAFADVSICPRYKDRSHMSPLSCRTSYGRVLLCSSMG